jgi:hypothetical protein
MKNTIISICFFVLFIPAKGQTNSDNSEPQYLFPDFEEGMVKMKNGKSQKIILNYNIVSEKMVYRKDEQLYDMVNTEMMDTVFLQDYLFIPVGKIFHQILLVGPISLFIQQKGDLIPPGTPAGYGGTSQVSSTKLLSSVELSSGHFNLKLPDDFKVQYSPVYWIRRESNYDSFTNERQFLKLFPGRETELKKFIKENHLKIDRIPDLVKLVEHCNESVK